MERDLRIKDSVRILFDARKKEKEIKKYVAEVNKRESLYIRNYMFANVSKEDKSFEIILDEGVDYYQNKTKVKVQEIRTSKVVWFLNKLKKTLTKEQYNSVVDKEYIITDIKGLITYLKKCGVNPKEFKKYISVTETLDQSKLEKAYETGEIKKKQISGCYEIEYGTPYVKLTELKT